MLHRINEAGCAAALRRVVRVQGEVLALACDPAYPIPPTEAGLRAAVYRSVQGDARDWLWERLWKDRLPAHGASPFQKLANAVAKHVQATPGRAAEVLDAFAYDIGF
jgi:hypothetical protein